MEFEQILKEVLWRLVTEGSVSSRRMKRVFGLNDVDLEDPRCELIRTLRIAVDLDGELLVWAPEGRPDPGSWRCGNHCRSCGVPSARFELIPTALNHD